MYMYYITCIQALATRSYQSHVLHPLKLPKSCFTLFTITTIIYIYIFIYIYIYISKPFSKHASHSLYTFLKLPKSCFTFLAITTSITKIYYINNSLVKVICRLLSNKKQKRMAAKLNAKTKP